ncbi:MAG: polysaccharide deacetylase family protein [Flavobacteriaceae bacterium]|jgi:peptidoglycan/xylan/chitin deacetylase (PgdA/CDA1 family)|nr:polysaccharide deacetylase family protein [Flavobacteriaceae bacterium]
MTFFTEPVEKTNTNAQSADTQRVKNAKEVSFPDSSVYSIHSKEKTLNKKDTAEKVVMVKDTGKCYIYLTLDDGPQLPGTLNCKNILQENNIKATFFMIGEHYFGKEKELLVSSIEHDPLFLVANHSNTHAFHNKYSYFYKCVDSSVLDFEKAEHTLNLKSKIARLPGRNTWMVNKQLKGESSAFHVAKKLDSMGYSVYGWDIEWRFKNGDIPIESASQMIKVVENAMKNNRTHQHKSVVILAHDRMFGKPQYADSLRKFITALKKDDRYVFETLENYDSLVSANN